MTLEEYMEQMYQEYESADQNRREEIIAQLKMEVVKLNSFAHKLEDREKENQKDYGEDKDNLE